MSQTGGELLFEAYLRGRDLTWEYEQPTGSTQPDYLVHGHTGDVLCEVKDFDENDVDRTLLTGVTMGLDPYRRIREKIRRAKVQFKPYRGRGIPCVLVLHNNRSVSITLEGFSVYGAMFGDLGVEIKLQPPYTSRPHVDLAKATLRRMANTTISAVAVLDQHRFNQPLFDEEIKKRVDQGTEICLDEEEPTVAVIERVFRAAEEIQLAHATVDFDARVPRVRWVPNPYAAVLLPRIFDGPYDGVLQPLM